MRLYGSSGIESQAKFEWVLGTGSVGMAEWCSDEGGK